MMSNIIEENEILVLGFPVKVVRFDNSKRIYRVFFQENKKDNSDWKKIHKFSITVEDSEKGEFHAIGRLNCILKGKEKTSFTDFSGK